METEMTTATEMVLELLRSDTKSKTCPHCNGCGECWCEDCTLWPAVNNNYREEFDTGRQSEGTCRTCNGFGVVDMEGKPIIEETGDFSD
jgi:RecJ-like exonuclease